MHFVPVRGTSGADPVLVERVVRHLVEVVSTTTVDSSPFAHMVLIRPFPVDVYQQMLALLPEDGLYRELRHSDAVLPNGRSARLQFPLVKANIDRLPPLPRRFWQSIRLSLTDDRVVAAYRDVFASELASVARRPASELRLRPYVTLFRDLGGYRISIHPDSPRKAITTQYYLPADESQVDLGTVFHARRDDGSFEIARSMRFAPNTGYAFAVTPFSYHSVPAMRPTDRPRNSLMLIVGHDRGPLIEGFRSARAVVRAWSDRVLAAKRNAGAPLEQGEGRVERA